MMKRLIALAGNPDRSDAISLPRCQYGVGVVGFLFDNIPSVKISDAISWMTVMQVSAIWAPGEK